MSSEHNFMGHKVSKKRFWALVGKAQVLSELERELDAEHRKACRKNKFLDLPELVAINGVEVSKKDFVKKVGEIENPSLWVGL
ncbi:MAG: hypothetical protein AABW59_04040 [archaeon]